MLEIRYSPSLSERTTLRLGGTAIAEILLHDQQDALLLKEALKTTGGTPCILGAGSNILAQDGTLPITLVRPVISGEPDIIGQNDSEVYVRVSAGMRLPRLLAFCASRGLSGLEGLCGIPGTVGGAVAMNAGSYGCEVCSRLYEVEIFEPEKGDVCRIQKGSFKYAYRSFKIENMASRFLILGATFVLTPGESDGIKQKMSLNFFKKKSTQPVKAHSAGCVFKNPPQGPSAGKLLDDAGFKGRKLSGMAFSSIHANFLINEGGGTSAVAFELISQAKEAVRTRFGIELETEVRVFPCSLM